MKNPNVVGTAEAAEILGKVVQVVSRYAKEGRMPEPAAELAATPLWHRRQIERLAEGGKVSGKARPLDLVSTKEAAVILDVDRSQIGRWRRAEKFPEPCAVLSAGPLWWREQIVEFADAR